MEKLRYALELDFDCGRIRGPLLPWRSHPSPFPQMSDHRNSLAISFLRLMIANKLGTRSHAQQSAYAFDGDLLFASLRFRGLGQADRQYTVLEGCRDFVDIDAGGYGEAPLAPSLRADRILRRIRFHKLAVLEIEGGSGGRPAAIFLASIPPTERNRFRTNHARRMTGTGIALDHFSILSRMQIGHNSHGLRNDR